MNKVSVQRLTQGLLAAVLAVAFTSGCSSTGDEVAKADANSSKKVQISDGPTAGCNTVAARKSKRCKG